MILPERKLKARWNLGYWLNDLGLIGRGVEIGTMQGQFALDLLRTWRGEKLYIVDAWREFEYWKDELCANRRENARRMMATFERIYDFGSRTCMIRDTSEDASRLFEDSSLDFVYIDAAHEYEVDQGDGKVAGIKRDIEIWSPKLRPGGVLAGHDYVNCWHNGTHFEVKRAVDEYAEKYNYEVIVTSDDIKLNPSWVIIKK